MWHMTITNPNPHAYFMCMSISVVTGHNPPCVHFKCTDFERCVIVQAYVLQNYLSDYRLNTYMDGWSRLYVVAPPSRTGPPLHPSPQFHADPTVAYAMSVPPAPPSAIPFDDPITQTAGIRSPVDPICGTTKPNHIHRSRWVA